MLKKANPDVQFLLQSESFTDYSGRTFNCTAFEYAYWAKDTHMCRMLLKHMDDETKREMLKKCDANEENGLIYLQDGELKQSSHFDFTPLINALNDFVEKFEMRTWDERVIDWRKVGIPQRDLPAHAVHEYCRPDRSFHPRPDFNEPTLPRVLTFHNWETGRNEAWFPVRVDENSGLGVNFAVHCGGGRASPSRGGWGMAQRRGGVGAMRCSGASIDLAAISHLDEVRSADLEQLRNALNVAEHEENPGMYALQ